jgi:GTP-binding protein Era
MKKNSHHKSGYVAFVGRPNVGKSTLVNALLEFKLSIVTRKPQTTRHRILGILSENNYQAILLDTPGLIEPHYKLQETMIKAVSGAIADADILILILDATREIVEQELETCHRLVSSGKPVLLVVNKIDLVNKNALLPLINQFRDEARIKHILPISALKGEGLDDVKANIINLLPPGPPFYPQDQITEHPERFFVAEIIREQIFRKFKEEIPYATTVVIDEFKEREKGKDFINARIVVERSSQKGILIGKGGSALKELGGLARKEIEDFLGRAVFLELWVTVREKWRSKDIFLKEFGYKQ